MQARGKDLIQFITVLLVGLAGFALISRVLPVGEARYIMRVVWELLIVVAFVFVENRQRRNNQNRK